jgi:hypothetical protein
MLKPIRVTDARLNSPTDQASQKKPKKEKKSVTFTAKSTFRYLGEELTGSASNGRGAGG